MAPELQDALAYALRYISQNRSADPIRVCAEKLLEFHAQLHPEPAPLPTSGSGDTADSTEADDEQAKLRTMARGRGRRQVVFSEPVKLDGAWTPVVVPKSEEERAEIAAVLQKNILFAAMDDDQRRILIDAMVKSDAAVIEGGSGAFARVSAALFLQTRKEFGEGVAIISQGDPGDYYYILTDGTAEILVNGRKVLQARAIPEGERSR